MHIDMFHWTLKNKSLIYICKNTNYKRFATHKIKLKYVLIGKFDVNTDFSFISP